MTHMTGTEKHVAANTQTEESGMKHTDSSDPKTIARVSVWRDYTTGEMHLVGETHDGDAHYAYPHWILGGTIEDDAHALMGGIEGWQTRAWAHAGYVIDQALYGKMAYEGTIGPLGENDRPLGREGSCRT